MRACGTPGESLAKHGLTEACQADRADPRSAESKHGSSTDVMRRRANEACGSTITFGPRRLRTDHAQLPAANTFFKENLAYIVVPACPPPPCHGLLLRRQLDQAHKGGAGRCAELPGDIDLAGQIVPPWIRTAASQERNKLYSQVAARYEELCKAYPQSSWGHNSLAWLSVCCHRHLDKALDHARRRSI